MSLVYEGFTFTGKCGDCGKEFVSQDPEPLFGWMQLHYSKCPFWRALQQVDTPKQELIEHINLEKP